MRELAAGRARAISQKYDAALRGTDLTITQLTLLMMLAQMHRPRVNDLAEALAMDQTSLSRTLRIMERDGLIAAVAGDDKRETRWVLASRGQQLSTLFCVARHTGMARSALLPARCQDPARLALVIPRHRRNQPVAFHDSQSTRQARLVHGQSFSQVIHARPVHLREASSAVSTA